jgi:hypothetical protein
VLRCRLFLAARRLSELLQLLEQPPEGIGAFQLPPVWLDYHLSRIRDCCSLRQADGSDARPALAARRRLRSYLLLPDAISG